MITKFDKINLSAIRADIDAALAEVAKKHGISLRAASAKYADSNFTMKVEGATLDESGKASLREAEDFRRYASLIGLKNEDLGREFLTPKGKRYRLVGFRAKSRKFPMLCEDLSDGKLYCLPEKVVVDVLKGTAP
jgi:hypothetical protein